MRKRTNEAIVKGDFYFMRLTVWLHLNKWLWLCIGPDDCVLYLRLSLALHVEGCDVDAVVGGVIQVGDREDGVCVLGRVHHNLLGVVLNDLNGEVLGEAAIETRDTGDMERSCGHVVCAAVLNRVRPGW